MRNRLTSLVAAGMLSAAAVFGAGCGGDDEDNDTEATQIEAVTTTGGVGAPTTGTSTIEPGDDKGGLRDGSDDSGSDDSGSGGSGSDDSGGSNSGPGRY
jgi:peptidoglycan DL-endopeptidase RipA